MDMENLEILILGLLFNEGFSGLYKDLNKYTDENIGRDSYGYAIENLIRKDLITGFIEIPVMGTTYPTYKANNPRLTGSGRKYFRENGTLWGKIKNILKEIKDITPGI